MLLSDCGFYYGTYNFEFSSPTLSLLLLPSLRFISIWNILYYSFPIGYTLRNAQRNHHILDSKVQLGYSPFSVLKQTLWGQSTSKTTLHKRRTLAEDIPRKDTLEKCGWREVSGRKKEKEKF